MPTPITITAAGVVIPAQLNDTVAAADLRRRLPLRTSALRSRDDYCASVACGRFDPSQMQTGWRNGDVSLGGGWLAIHFGGQERSGTRHDLMVVAHIDERDLPLVRALPEAVALVVEVAR